MPIDSDLQAAGRRAGAQHVPTPPPLASLEAGAAKHTSRRRLILSSAAGLVLVALAFPLALTMRGSTTVQTVAAGTGQAAAAQLEPGPAAAQGDLSDDADADSDEGVRIQLRSGGDFSVSIRVLSGEQAVSVAEAAAAGATETLDVDGLAVWVSEAGDERTVSALVEPDEFIEVTGNAAELDMLIDVLRDGGMTDHGGIRGSRGLDGDEWQQFFEEFDDGHFNFDEFFGPDGELNFDRYGFSFDGDFDFDEFFGPDGEFNFDEFFGPDGIFDVDGDGFSFDGDFDEFFGPDGFTFPTDAFGGNVHGCIVIDDLNGDRGEPFHLEFPGGCATAD